MADSGAADPIGEKNKQKSEQQTKKVELNKENKEYTEFDLRHGFSYMMPLLSHDVTKNMTDHRMHNST